jgi:Flp pilus assembly protein TadD
VRALGEAAADPEVQQTLVRAAVDPVRLARLEAAFALRGADVPALPAEDRASVERAFAEWLAAQQVLDERPETHFNRGVFWTARGDAAQAERSYRHATALWPGDPTPRQNLAMLLAGAGRGAEAKAEREPTWVPGRFALGLLAQQARAWDEAAAHFEQCLAAAPDYPAAALQLGHVYAAAGDQDRAAAAFERATRDPSARTEALRELVRLAYARGDEAAAQRWLPEAVLADPSVAADPRLHEALGLAPGAPSAPP